MAVISGPSLGASVRSRETAVWRAPSERPAPYGPAPRKSPAHAAPRTRVPSVPREELGSGDPLARGAAWPPAPAGGAVHRAESARGALRVRTSGFQLQLRRWRPRRTPQPHGRLRATCRTHSPGVSTGCSLCQRSPAAGRPRPPPSDRRPELLERIPGAPLDEPLTRPGPSAPSLKMDGGWRGRHPL